MFVDQVSVFVENKQGTLKDILEILKDGGIGLRALSIADTSDFGILRMIVDDTDGALDRLKDSGVMASRTRVIGCKLLDRPGSLYDVLDALHGVGTDVAYLYSFISGGEAYIILRVDDNEKARKALQDAGHTLVRQDDIL